MYLFPIFCYTWEYKYGKRKVLPVDAMQIVLISVGILFVLFISYMNWETRQLTVTRHTFRTRKKQIKNPITFLHMTDLHLGRINIKQQEILNTIKEIPSDFLVFTGDYFEKEEHIPRLLHLIDAIREIYAMPIFLCYGNHDRKDGFAFNKELEEKTTKQLQERNVTVLENQATIYQKHAEDGQITSLRIIGLSDARSNQADIPAVVQACYADTADAVTSQAALNSTNTATSKAIPTLLMTHNSDIMMKMEPASVDFAVAGHTHGAQTRTPFNIEIKLLHRRDILASRQNIIRGAHRYKEMDLYINRGLGCTLFPIRFLSKPEIAVITIAE